MKNTGVFLEIVVLDTPLPYVGVSVGTVTHKQRLELYALQENTFTGLIVNWTKTWYRNSKNAELRYVLAVFSY